MKKDNLTDSFGLKEDWENLFKSVGVSSFEELLGHTAELTKGRDTSKLVPVKKQITRGGRTVETTVYVSPEEAEEIKKNPSKKKAEKNTTKPVKGKAEVNVISPNDTKGLKELRQGIKGWKSQEAVKALNEASKDHYLLAANVKGKVVGVGAFKREKDNLHMEHFGSSGELSGVGKQIVSNLITQAGKQNLGVTIKPPAGSLKLLEKLGFEDDFSGLLKMSPEKVKAKSGSNTKTSKESE